jgi:hypothetical protein
VGACGLGFGVCALIAGLINTESESDRVVSTFSVCDGAVLEGAAQGGSGGCFPS